MPTRNLRAAPLIPPISFVNCLTGEPSVRMLPVARTLTEGIYEMRIEYPQAPWSPLGHFTIWTRQDLALAATWLSGHVQAGTTSSEQWFARGTVGLRVVDGAGVPLALDICTLGQAGGGRPQLTGDRLEPRGRTDFRYVTVDMPVDGWLKATSRLALAAAAF